MYGYELCLFTAEETVTCWLFISSSK